MVDAALGVALIFVLIVALSGCGFILKGERGDIDKDLRHARISLEAATTPEEKASIQKKIEKLTAKKASIDKRIEDDPTWGILDYVGVAVLSALGLGASAPIYRVALKAIERKSKSVAKD